MGFQGNDPDALDRAATDTEDRAQDIKRLVGELDGKCQQVNWTGDDSDRFKRTDWPDTKQNAEDLVKCLGEIADTLRNNAQAQRTVSA